MTTQAEALKVRHAFENIRNNYVGWQDNPNFKVLEEALAALATVSSDAPDRIELQAKGKHPAPCARHCEANAFYIEIRQLKAQLAASASPAPVRPIDMILHCPACGLQHIDKPDPGVPSIGKRRIENGVYEDFHYLAQGKWTNPPHRSHLCRSEDGGCGHTWRPADVPTNGVAAIETKGKADSAAPDVRPSVPVSDAHILALARENFMSTLFTGVAGAAFPSPDSNGEIIRFARALLSQPVSVPPISDAKEPVAINDTKKARSFLIHYMADNFEDKSFLRYIRDELAGDFAYNLARAMNRAPSPSVPVSDDWRRELALAYCPGSLLYTDDGELQDNRVHPFIDFLRYSPSAIGRIMRERATVSVQGVSNEEMLHREIHNLKRHIEDYCQPAALVQQEALQERHYDDYAVDCFAQIMKAKLAKKRAEGRGGWNDPAQCSVEYLNRLLLDHVEKGDPVDVANFCMMLRHYDAKITSADAADQMDIDREGARFWHRNCTNHLGGVMKVVKEEPTQSLIQCLHCGKSGYYPVGGVGRIRAGQIKPQDGWQVTIEVDAERILTISDQHYAGVSDIDHYADVVRNCAKHLLAFIGEEEAACTEPNRSACPRLCQDFCNEAEIRALKGQQPAQADKPDIESTHAARAIAAYEASGATTPWTYLDPAEWSKWEKIADVVHTLSKG